MKVQNFLYNDPLLRKAGLSLTLLALLFPISYFLIIRKLKLYKIVFYKLSSFDKPDFLMYASNVEIIWSSKIQNFTS